MPRRNFFITALVLLVLCLSASADIPYMVNHQGSVKVNGVPFTGAGLFKFGLVDASGMYIWTNDGTRLGSAATVAPDDPVTIDVSNGHYNVRLGDTALTNMLTVPSTCFDSADVKLRIYFNDGENGEAVLSPDQKVTATPYAYHAAVADGVGSVTASAIESLTDGGETIQHKHTAERVLHTYRSNCAVTLYNSESIRVLPGVLAIPNAAGTDVRYRRNTISTIGDWTLLDTGSEANSTQYYVYGVGDNSEDTTFSVVLSADDLAPSGASYCRRIGYFYNNSSGDIVNVGNIKAGDVSNAIMVHGAIDDSSSAASGVFDQIDDLEVRFVSRGGNVKVSLVMTVRTLAADIQAWFRVEVDGVLWTKATIVTAGSNRHEAVAAEWAGYLPAGEHVARAKWSPNGTGTIYHNVAWARRTLIVEEL